MTALGRWLLPGLAAAGLLAQGPQLIVWTRAASGRVSGGPERPEAVGSLQKPWVAKAWALAHPGSAAPRSVCTPEAACWLPTGHGPLGLSRALAVSCNAYFRALAEATPPDLLQRVFREAGFQAPPRTPDQAIGLEPGPTILPSRLLEAYDRLQREPWAQGEALRGTVLQGLREAARSGTAKGLTQPGLLAKTGTVPSRDGDPRHTVGWVLAMEPGGSGRLARLEHGTGREAAARLLQPPESLEGSQVRVQLLALLPGPFTVRNLEAAPLPSTGGFLGPGGERRLRPGDWVGPGLLELRTTNGFRRQLRGRLQCRWGRGSTPELVAHVALRDYVAGVLAAELPGVRDSRRLELGAAILRFLRQGPRHRDVDVCDNTHCAWFIGAGPRLDWRSPTRAVALAAPVDPPPSEAEWTAFEALAQQPGPSRWSAHCGGEPLSSHALWASGDEGRAPCPRHGPEAAAPWVRHWPSDRLRQALGREVLDLAVVWKAGTWHLQIRDARGSRELRYDTAHRVLATTLGWDGLPSPADEVRPVAGGWEARGRGSGHRVGLCLGE